MCSSVIFCLRKALNRLKGEKKEAGFFQEARDMYIMVGVEQSGFEVILLQQRADGSQSPSMYNGVFKMRDGTLTKLKTVTQTYFHTFARADINSSILTNVPNHFGTETDGLATCLSSILPLMSVQTTTLNTSCSCQINHSRISRRGEC